MAERNNIPDLGQFFGDAGGPGTTTPNTMENGNKPTCPFADPKMGEFCTLDGAMCPFVGFNYRRCRKYTNNMAKGNMQALPPSAPNSSGGGPPRTEAVELLEARRKRVTKAVSKKRGPKPKVEQVKAKDLDIEGLTLADLPPEAQEAAAWMAHLDLEGGGDYARVPEETKKAAVVKFLHTRRTPDSSYYDPDDENYVLKNVHGDLVAAALHLAHGIKPGKARDMGADFSNIAHAAAGEAFDRSDMYAREKAHQEAMEKGDRSVADMFANKNVQGNKQRGGATTDDPEDIGHQHSARTAASTPPPHENVPPPDDSYAPDADSHPDPTKPKRGFRHLVGGGGAKPTPGQTAPGTKPLSGVPDAIKDRGKGKEKKKPKDKYRGSERTFAKHTSEHMTAEQFEAFLTTTIDPLTPAERDEVFAGLGHYGQKMNAVQLRKELVNRANKLADKKDYLTIANNAKILASRAKSAHDIRTNRMNLERAWDSNLEVLKKFPIGDRKAHEMMLARTRKDPEQLGKAAKFMNTLMDKAYRIEAKNIKIGKDELTTFVREVTLPQFKRSDYEVMRMAEQMGLAAIQKQHQYGRGYGRWNTWHLFFKQVVVPLVLFKFEAMDLLPRLMSIWPSELLDQFYFAYVKKVLPKLSPHDSGAIRASRDTKFLNSQRMLSGRHKRIMAGFARDNILPPDRAVMHSRWYPTTKETWGKKRSSELAARYEKTKALPATTTKRTFMRR